MLLVSRESRTLKKIQFFVNNMIGQPRKVFIAEKKGKIAIQPYTRMKVYPFYHICLFRGFTKLLEQMAK